jgi:hypothetical protein
MANIIPGVPQRTQPRVFVRTKTLSRSVAGNTGSRLLCIVGEGEAEETLVESARGSGADGVNSDFSGSNAPDGRHFEISKTSLIENRVSIFKNGSSLRVLEAQIDTDPFDSRYDARVEILTGRIQLQQAYLANQGGTTASPQYWSSQLTNAGNGQPNITTLSLVDAAAPAEFWTLRCVAVVRDGAGALISGKATFALSGSVSGVLKDANGNPIRWKSDGVVFSNEMLSFSISEGAVAFDVGDRFTLEVQSGVLSKNDNLTARYIAEQDLEDPEVFDSGTALFAKHGEPSTTNTLSLAAQMAFENGAPRIICLQAKPSVPRRSSATLIQADNPLTVAVEGATGSVANTDCILPLPLGAKPDADTEVHVFITSSDGTEEQLVLSKQAFYNPSYNTLASAYSSFVTGAFSQSYTVIDAPQVESSGVDGYAIATSTTEMTFQSDTAFFSVDYLDSGEDDTGNKQIQIISPPALAALWNIDTVGDGYGDNTTVTATRATGSHTDGYSFSDVQWRLVDNSDIGQYVCLTDDIVLNYLTAGKGLRVSYIDQDDAAFFDSNWTSALEALETVELQILVPVPTATISNIFQAARVHCETMSSTANARERNLIIGALDGLLPENLIGTADAAAEDIGLLEGIQGDDVEEVLAGNIEDLADYSVTAAYGNTFRVVYMAPDRIVRSISGTNTTLPGFYLAACLGGHLAAQSDFAQPVTFKTLAGFNILRDRQYRQTTLDELADAGVCVVQPVSGGGKILHGLTTTQSGAPEEEEISIVHIRDATSRALRGAVEPFIGTVSGPTTVPSMTSAVKNTLEGLVTQGLLTGFTNLLVKRNPVEPRQYDVSVTVAPATPINWVFCDVSVTIS